MKIIIILKIVIKKEINKNIRFLSKFILANNNKSFYL